MNFEQIIYRVMAVLFAISIHEFAHGMAAYKLGDPTPKAQGRLTLNPLAHLDPIGAIMLVLVRIGWAKPVQINPLYFKNRRQSMILVAIAGPLTNIMAAWFFTMLSLLIIRLPLNVNLLIGLYAFFNTNIMINIWLAAFNLIPIPPLDGSKVVANLLPVRNRIMYEKIAPYAPLLLIIGIWTGALQYILNPISNVLLSLISALSF